ncbi:MAG: RnfABCDGE type electron transport complex subunit G [Bacteroidales bacterium]
MQKLSSTLPNMVLSLTIISIATAIALGFVYEKTKDPIAKGQQAKITNAIAEVLPPFDNDPTKEMTQVEGEDLVVFKATKGGKWVGSAVKTYSPKGFSGKIVLMVGFLPDGTINNISVVDQKETPGLGTKMKEPKFKDQFKQKNPNSYKLMVKKDGGDVDAITASTITSRAFCDAVNRAFEAFKKGGAK